MTKQEKQERAARARLLMGGDDGRSLLAPPEAKRDARADKGANREGTGSVSARSGQPVRPQEAAPGSQPRSAKPSLPPVAWRTPARLLPTKWERPPARGDMVFYRGERFFVEPPVALSFMDSCWVRIGDHRVPKESDHDPKTGQHRPCAAKRVSFYVHADEIAAVPPEFNLRAARLPTVAGVARAQRAKAGIRDVGDEIADTLRRCKDLTAVYVAAAEYLGTVVDALKEKYGHLNPGQQRMNLGNKMRFKWRKEHV